jgi:hypothetical protein
MTKAILLFLLLIPVLAYSQAAKTDTIEGVVTYVAPSDLIHISKGDYYTYTVRATEVRSDTGVISIHTNLGYLDLRKNYQFIPMNKLQPARLKQKP